jgi:cytochrome bd-type quinol oxidase subunit 2
MKRLLLPQTILGKWSIGLIIACLLVFILAQILVSTGTGHRGGGTFSSNLIHMIPMILAAICGTAAFFTGIIGIIKSKERSITVFLATLLGLFVLIFWLGEIIFPH